MQLCNAILNFFLFREHHNVKVERICVIIRRFYHNSSWHQGSSIRSLPALHHETLPSFYAKAFLTLSLEHKMQNKTGFVDGRSTEIKSIFCQGNFNSMLANIWVKVWVGWQLVWSRRLSNDVEAWLLPCLQRPQEWWRLIHWESFPPCW